MVSEYSHCRRVAGAVGQVQHTDLAQHVHVTATDALLAFRHPEADTHMKKIKKKIGFWYLYTGWQYSGFQTAV